MNKFSIISLVIISLFLLFLVTGCEDTGGKVKTKSISERLSEFKSDLEGDPANLWVHVHPDNSMKNTLKETDTWNPPFDFDGLNNYSFSNLSGSGDTRTATLSGDTYDGGTLTFTMKEDDKDYWYIMHLDLDEGGSHFDVF